MKKKIECVCSQMNNRVMKMTADIVEKGSHTDARFEILEHIHEDVSHQIIPVFIALRDQLRVYIL